MWSGYVVSCSYGAFYATVKMCVCVRACVAVKELCVAVLLIWVFDTERSVYAAVKVCVYVAVK